MKIHLFERVPFEIDIPKMLKKMNLKRDHPGTDQIIKQLQEGARIAAPKAVYGEARIQERGEETLLAEGIRFRSRMLMINTQKTEWLFPYLATCGSELEEWREAQSSPLEQYVASLVEEEACRNAMMFLFKVIDDTHQLQFSSSMNPGSLDDWPLSEQRQLFQLLEDSHKALGIQLLDSLLMKPAKSVSGVRFSGTHAYTNCQVCSRQSCPGRMEPYDPEARKRYHELSSSNS